MDYRTIVVRFRLNAISDKQAFEALQVHGFPKDLKEEVLQILWNDRRTFLSKPNNGKEILAETIEKLEKLLRDWQTKRKRKERKNNDVFSPKT